MEEYEHDAVADVQHDDVKHRKHGLRTCRMCTVRGDDTHAEAVVCEDGEDEEDDDEGHMRMSQMLSKMAVSKKAGDEDA